MATTKSTPVKPKPKAPTSAPATSAPLAASPKAPEQSALSALPPAAGGGGEQIASRTLKVTAKVEGFRRAGRAWSKIEETVSADEFSTDQVDALLAEAMLDVVVVAE